ncbi:MAG: hypothetical protein NVS2B7_15170 [Herpetosiphon sp.]
MSVLKADGYLSEAGILHRVRYLNNLDGADDRFNKRPVRLELGFGSLASTTNMLTGDDDDVFDSQGANGGNWKGR